LRRKIRVGYNTRGDELGLPQHLFAKAAPTWLTRLASSADIASVESRFLRELRPTIDIEAPTLVYAAVDKASGRMIEIFGDLVETRGARFFNWKTDISRDQAEQIVDTLATLHASFRVGASQGEYTWLPPYGGRILKGERNGLHAAHETAMLEAEGLVPERLFQQRAAIWPAALASVGLNARATQSVLHSDVHLGNWYEASDGRVGLADWQCTCTGHWARDVAYALSSTLDVEDRRAWERDLLARYLDTSAEISGAREPDEDAWLAYRQQLVPALLAWTPTLHHTPTMPDMQPIEMSQLMVARIGTAMDDLDAVAAVGAA
jgi:hypothetical protein